MFIIYDLIFLIFMLAYLPVYLLRGKFHRGFSRRLGILPPDLDLERPIWVHAVSVGEAIAVKALVVELRKAYPRKKLVISTVTATGNKIAEGLIKPGDFLTYLPLDLSFITGPVIRKINPCIFIIAETEIWPNLIRSLYKQKVPVVTVNGRISDGSYAGYRLIKSFIRPTLSRVRRFCVQSATDASRLEELGVDKEKIHTTGNVKFDMNLDALTGINSLDYRNKLWLGSEDKLLVCGSTHPGEEEQLIKVYKELLVSFPKLKLLIAPRHPERSKDIAELAAKNGFMPIFISTISSACPACVSSPVFILDVMGELLNFYASADIVFVGGSLVKTGGHNILEPAGLKKPVIFGPHMFNFRDITEMFLQNKAGIMVADAAGLKVKIKELLENSLLGKGFGERAHELISKNSGATMRNIGIIKELLELGEILCKEIFI